jgi:hypothetical protein
MDNVPLRYVLWVIKSTCALLTPPLAVMFALEYTGNVKWLTRRSLFVLSLPALTFALLASILPSSVFVSIEAATDYGGHPAALLYPYSRIYYKLSYLADQLLYFDEMRAAMLQPLKRLSCGSCWARSFPALHIFILNLCPPMCRRTRHSSSYQASPL